MTHVPESHNIRISFFLGFSPTHNVNTRVSSGVTRCFVIVSKNIYVKFIRKNQEASQRFFFKFKSSTWFHSNKWESRTIAVKSLHKVVLTTPGMTCNILCKKAHSVPWLKSRRDQITQFSLKHPTIRDLFNLELGFCFKILRFLILKPQFPPNSL